MLKKIMKFLSALHATAGLIYFSLFPQGIFSARRRYCKAITLTEQQEILPGEIATVMAAFSAATTRDNRITIVFLAARSVAAPFLLFRLKRSGYSGCEVAVLPHGLLLTARR